MNTQTPTPTTATTRTNNTSVITGLRAAVSSVNGMFGVRSYTGVGPFAYPADTEGCRDFNGCSRQ